MGTPGNESTLPIDRPKHAQLDADVLVIGAGLAGLTAVLDLAGAGRSALLVDNSGAHGGAMTLLDRQFPTDSCGFCQILPREPEEAEACLKSILHHPRITFLPYTTVSGVDGSRGDFTVTLTRQATGVDATRCTHCGRCIEACPETYPDPLHGGVIARKAVGYRAPMCTPSDLAVDWEHCTLCGACVTACPEEAVDLGAQDWTQQRHVGALILATGFKLHQPSDRAEYGYGRFLGVMTTFELERLLAKSLLVGREEIRNPANGRKPSRIAWIQCVGSRDEERSYCSSVCCMISLKEARRLRNLLPKAHLEIFYMDIRTCGKGYEAYLNEAIDMGIILTRGRPGEVLQRGGQLWLQVEGPDDTWREDPFDMVVLSVGFEASAETRRLADLLGCTLDPAGFFLQEPGSLSRTQREGVYVAGAAAEPRDIPETVIQAHEAAALSIAHAAHSESLGFWDSLPVTDLGEEDLRILVALCDCSGTLASSLDFEALRARLERESEVKGAVLNSRLCLVSGMERLQQELQKYRANALVVGACTPRWLRSRLRQIFSGVGLDPNLVRIVNLREQGVWSHGQNLSAVTERVFAELQAAVAMCRGYRSLPQPSPGHHHREVLVLGGGPAGMSAALTLSEVGQPVTLVECEAELGGNLRWIRYGLEARFRPDALLENLLKSLKAAPSIEVLTETTVLKARGRPGAFQLTLKGPSGNEKTRSFGAFIVATGGRIHQPAAFGYGEDPRVMSQRDLEWALTRNELDLKTLREVIMIQCVGSRDEEHPYCSRICCAAALKNALRLLEANSDLRLFIFYRDIRAFGTLERYYLKAREMGGLFIPFDTLDPPILEIQDGDISLTAYDPLVGARVRFRPDRVILSTGIVPEVPADVWAPLGLSVNNEGFLVEAHSKFRPLDLQDGVYACGLALGPAFVGEAMAQGRGAALRALAFLERLRRPAALPGVSVQESRCAACGLCVTACPYGARELDEEQDHAVIHSHLCQACGLCAAVCPNDATQLRGSTNRQILSAVDALFEK